MFHYILGNIIIPPTKHIVLLRKLWSSGRALGSWLEGRGFDPRPMLDGNGVCQSHARLIAGAWLTF